MQSEFLREFENESPELLTRVFRAWRRRSKFMPTVAEVYALLEEEAQARYREKQNELWARYRQDAERARESWQDPAQHAELQKTIKTLGERLTLSRMNNLRKLARRAPENVKALSQAKALRTAGGKHVA